MLEDNNLQYISTSLGREFIVSEHDIRHNRVIRVDKNGKIKKQFKVEMPLDLDYLGNGNLLISANQAIIELDKNFQKTWEFRTDRLAFFSCQKMSNGNILFGDASKAMICELNKNGDIVKSFNFPLSKNPENYLYDFRLIRSLPNGNILIACHNDKRIAKFDWNGNIYWSVNLEGKPYMPIQKKNGNIVISLGPASKIVEITPDGEKVWEYDMEKDNGLERGWIAGITLLESGNIIYSDSKYDRLIEINPKKEIVGRFQNRNVLLHPSTNIIL